MNNAIVLIGMPTLSHIYQETFVSTIALASQMQAVGKIYSHKGSVVHDSRNKIVKRALDSGCTHVMFIDSDMSFKPDSVDRLLAHNVDIVGGVYVSKRYPNVPNMAIRDPKDPQKLKIMTEFPQDKLFKVFALGTGFLLVRAEVFKNMEPPYFHFGKWNGRDIGEDYYFCIKAGAKYDIWADPTIPLGHVGEYPFSLDNWYANKADIEGDVDAVEENKSDEVS